MYTSVLEIPEEVAPQAGAVASALLAGVSAMDDATLVEAARLVAGEISAAEAHLAALVAEIERRGVHGQWECRRVERFTGWQLQQSPARTAALLDVGRAMTELAVLAEAVADGSLGFDKAASIARVAAPDTEKALVTMAMHATVGQTRRICGQWRKVELRDAAAGSDAAAEHERRSHPEVIVIRDEDGVEVRVRFDHVRGELVLAALETETKAVRRERAQAAPIVAGEVNDPAGRAACDDDRSVEKFTLAQWRALGFLRMVERSAGEQPEGLTASGFATTVVTHVGIDTLYGPDLPDPLDPGRSPRPTRDEMAELEPSGVRVRREVARFLACDAGLLTVLEDRDGNPLHLGRRTSSIPPALRKAVMSRHRTCTWPGCCATAVQLHHIHHRSAGGHDDVEAIVPECFDHHLAIHLHGIWITVDPDGTVHHWRPDGTELLANPMPASPTDAVRAPGELAQRRLHHGGHADATRRPPLWQGDPLSLGDCIAALESRRDAALRRTTPTRGTPVGPIRPDREHPPPNLN
jgi:hypothetical protein